MKQTWTFICYGAGGEHHHRWWQECDTPDPRYVFGLYRQCPEHDGKPFHEGPEQEGALACA